MAHGATLFRLLNLIVALLIILGGVLLFVNNKSWNSSILGVVLGIFGILTFALEFVIPEAIVYNMGFLFSLLGRGIFYLIAGVLSLAWKWFNIVVGCIIMAAGVFYIAMHFFGATPSPSMSAVPSTTTDLNPGYGGAQYTNPSDGQPNMAQNYQSPNPAGNYQSPNPGARYDTHE
ncbi:Late Golgi vesicles protein [Mortierella sp. AM989]|nr:Late Golgi vesicles protein [Mortierella sp. AM989]KAF9116421.1 Late Golgi vesicles protein [Mortierella sp. AM989]